MDLPLRAATGLCRREAHLFLDDRHARPLMCGQIFGENLTLRAALRPFRRPRAWFPGMIGVRNPNRLDVVSIDTHPIHFPELPMSLKSLAPFLAAMLSFAPTSQAANKSPPDPDTALVVYMAKGYPDATLEGTTYAMPGSWYGISAAKPGAKPLKALLASLGLPAKGKPGADAKRSDTAPKLFDTDLGAYLPSNNPSYLTGDPPATKHFELTPAASYFFKTDTDFAVNCEFKAELIDGGKPTWQARYLFNRDATFSTHDPQVGAKLEDNFRDCFQLLSGMFALHRVKGEKLFRQADLTKGKNTVTRQVMYLYFPQRVIYLDDEGMVDEDPAHFDSANMK